MNPAIDEAVLDTCDDDLRAIELLAAVGLLDRVVPIDGSRDPFVAVDVWFPAAAHLISSCADAEESMIAVSESVNARRGLDCARCARLFESIDGGHTWPGGTEGLNGAPPGSFRLTTAISQMSDQAPGDCRTH